MAVFPCNQKGFCIDPANPFQNLSAELPDQPVFISRYTGFGPAYPPLGSEFVAAGCTAFCESTVSQQEADLCAARDWVECLSTSWPTGSVGPDRFGNPTTIPHARPVFRNRAQTITIFCADGNPFTYTVPAGRYSAFSQALADEAALSDANENAPRFIVCISDLSQPQVCANAEYSDSVTASGDQLTDENAFWSIIGFLPDGIRSDIDTLGTGFTGSKTLNFFGSPTTPGTYSFSIRVEDANGDFMVKPVTINVAAITNADSLTNPDLNMPYSQNLDVAGFTNPLFSLEGGALPDGLSLNSGGIIFGTPTVQGTFDFTVGVTEAGTGRMCLQDLELVVQGDVGCSDVPVQTFTTPVFYTNLAAVPDDALLMACDGFTPTFDLYDVADGLMTFITTQTSARTFGRMAWSPLADEWVYVGVDGGVDSWFESYNKMTLAMTGSALALAGIIPPFIPWAINVSAATGMAYASVNNSGDIIVSYNSVTRLAGPSITLPVPSNLGSIGINDAANRVYFAGGHNNTIGAGPAQLIVRNATTLAAVAAHNLPNPFGHGYVQGCVYNPDTGMVYVAGNDEDADGGDVIWVVNPVTGVVTTTIRLLTNIWNFNNLIQANATTLVYVPARHQIYVFASEHKNFPNANGGIQVICCDTNSKIAFLNLNPDPAFGSDIGNVDVQNVVNTAPPDTLTVFVTEENNGTVREFTFP